MRFDYDLGADSDRELLRSFFKSLWRGFEQIVFENLWGDRVIAFFGDGQNYLRGALLETREEFERALTAVEREPRESFEKVGLSGQSLRAKLYYIKFWANLALNAVPGAIGKTLSNINIVLGRIVSHGVV